MDPRVDVAASEAAAPRSGSLTARAAGAAFAVLFVVGFSMLTWTWDDSTVDSEVLGWYAEGGNRVVQVLGALLVALAGVALIWFLVGLRERLRATGQETLATASLVAGTVFTAALFAGGAAIAAVSGAVELGDEPIPTDADAVRIIAQMGYGAILLFGSLAASLCVLTATRAAHRSRLSPTWLSVVGYVAAVLLLAGVIYLPIAAFPIWVTFVAIWGFGPRRPSAEIDLSHEADRETPSASEEPSAGKDKDKRPMAPAHL